MYRESLILSGLKKSTNDNEIFDNNNYKIFRLGRTIKSHPPDPDNPKKYRLGGSGVVIACRSDLDGSTTRLKFNTNAEIMSVAVKPRFGKILYFHNISCWYLRG